MALKPASIYGAMAAAAASCPPGSSQAKFYEDLASMILTILKDVDVPGLGLIAPPGTAGGPVTGSAKLA